MLNCLIKRNHNLAVVFLDETTSEDEVLLAELDVWSLELLRLALLGVAFPLWFDWFTSCWPPPPPFRYVLCLL